MPTPLRARVPTALPILLAVLLAGPEATAGQVGPDSLANPFRDFETHHLPNGVRVWYRSMPGATNVSVSVTLPYGSDQDPVGKEEVAHFTEHLLFTDHRGRTEEEVKEEIEGRGGTRNGITYPDHSHYFVNIGREHGLFALRWLGWLVEPRAISDEVVERNRQPVALEIRAKPRELVDWAVAVLDPEWLRHPDFWAREFGLAVRSARRWDAWETLHGLTGNDVQAFHRRYYVLGAMTVMVAGDIPRDSVLAVAEEAFGSLEPRAVPAAYPAAEDPDRYRRDVVWSFRTPPRYRTIFKVFEPTAADHQTLLFLRDLLDRRLGKRLRYGERKAVYGLSVSVVHRGPALFLALDGSVAPDALDYARQVVEEEMDALRAGEWEVDAFEEDRTALVELLRSRNRTPESLTQWVRYAFYDPHLYPDFPDLLSFYARMTPEDLVAFAEGHLGKERQVEWLYRRQPVSQAVAAALVLLLVLVSVRLTGKALTTPLEMRRLRYVARIRLSLPFLAAFTAVFLGVGLALLRLLMWAGEWGLRRWVLPVDVYWVQMAVWVGMGALAVAAAVAWLSLVPRKILVFPDHVRIKSLAYRSRALRPEDVEELALRRFASVWLTKRILRTVPFATGLMGPALYLEPRNGRALFFRVRDSAELFEVLGDVLSPAPPLPGAVESAGQLTGESGSVP